MLPALWNVFSVEVRKRMFYRADFWINSVAGIAVTFSLYWFLARAMFAVSARPMLGGYTVNGMLLYYVFALLMGRIVQANEMEMGIAQDIYDGSLSRYLLYPVPYAAVKFAQQTGSLAPQFIQLGLVGVLAPLVMRVPQDVHITATSVAMAMVSLALANVLHFVLILPIQAVAFWADNVWSLVVAERIAVSLMGGLMLPLDLFPAWARHALYLSPFPYLYAVPVRALMGKVSPMEWITGIAVSLIWCGIASVVARLVWRRGDLQYTGVGI
jgi:ABC-2 type transport system permease protein